HHAPVPDRGGGSDRLWRLARHRNRLAADVLGELDLTGQRPDVGSGRGHHGFCGDRSSVRFVAGAEGFEARSDSRAALRIGPLWYRTSYAAELADEKMIRGLAGAKESIRPARM